MMNFNIQIFIIFVVINMPLKAVTRPIAANMQVLPLDMLNFLRRFGYLEPTANDAETLYHENAIIEAIKNVQKYGGINITGQIDKATMQLFSKPRCGVPDIKHRTMQLNAITTEMPKHKRKKRFVLAAQPWNKRKIRYCITNASKKISLTQVERSLQDAFAQWSHYSNLKFERSNNYSAEILIAFSTSNHGDNYPFDGPGNILAHAFYPYDEGQLGGDMHFDDDENWLENAPELSTGVDFYTVALHEIGHSLGLAHSSDFHSIMFPYYKGPEFAQLGYDDSLAMYEAYLKYSTLNELRRTNPQIVTEIETTTTAQLNVVNATTTKPLQNPAHSLHLCRGHFDAVAFFNGSVHIFKAAYVWQLTTRFTVQAGSLRKIHDIFPFLTANIQHIDTIFTRKDGILVIFTGTNYWLYNGTNTIEGSPRSIKELLGWNTQMQKIDAALLWSKNKRCYLFAEDQFWRFDGNMHIVDYGYPQSIKAWRGLPNNLDAAVTLPNDKTYFFKGNQYWLYNNMHVRPERGYPQRTSTAWLHCALHRKSNPHLLHS